MDSSGKDAVLEFQDIPFIHGQQAAPGSHTYTFSAPSASMNDEDDNGTANLNVSSSSNRSVWSFEYYQQYFDVDTDVVKDRLINSMIPRLGGNFIVTHLRPKPDLYGPFWICATLVCTLAVFGNIADFASSYNKSTDHHWAFEFRLVSAMATIIFIYAWIIPLILWTFLWYKKTNAAYTFLEMLGAYGYSLMIFVPASVFLIIPFAAFQWIVLLLAAFFSGSVLVTAIWPVTREINFVTGLISVAVVLILHMGLAAVFKYCFFAINISGTGGEPPVHSTIIPSLVTLNSTHT